MQRDNLGETEVLTLKTSKSSCKLTLLGAQIISFMPPEGVDVFWMGKHNSFTKDKAIRGGIPVCWPRFGLEELNQEFPKHGFARNQVWTLNALEETDEKVTISLSMQQDSVYQQLKHIAAMLYLKITLTDCLELDMETLNVGTEDIAYSEALHSYFAVADVNQISIKGLNGQPYYDSLDQHKEKIHYGDLRINEAVDAAFFNHAGSVQIHDEVLKRIITIDKNQSQATVVWNPYHEAVGAEVTGDDYKEFICVEQGNIAQHHCVIKPGERHKMTVKISVQPLA